MLYQEEFITNEIKPRRHEQSGMWYAMIGWISTGLYKTPFECGVAANELARRYYGDDAKLLDLTKLRGNPNV